MRKSKRFAALALVASFGLIAAACGSDNKSSGGLKVGLAFDTGGRGDGTFNDSAARGADQAKNELGVKLDELEATKADDRQPNLETLTKNGDKLIVAVGFAFGDALAKVAAANPNTNYAIVDGFIDKAPSNIAMLSFAENEGSFLVGAAAALKSKTGHIGFIGGQEIDLIKKFEAGYEAGAKYINKDIKIDVKYLGAAGDDTAWGSPDKAKEIANGWYQAGADVIYTAAGGSGQGTIEAAVANNAWAIGVDSDQYLTAQSEDQKQHILTSMLKRVDVAVYSTIKAQKDGTFKGGAAPIVYDLKTDGVGYSTSGGFVDDIKAQLDQIKADIVSGKITVPTKPGDVTA